METYDIFSKSLFIFDIRRRSTFTRIISSKGKTLRMMELQNVHSSNSFGKSQTMPNNYTKRFLLLPKAIASLLEQLQVARTNSSMKDRQFSDQLGRIYLLSISEKNANYSACIICKEIGLKAFDSYRKTAFISKLSGDMHVFVSFMECIQGFLYGYQEPRDISFLASVLFICFISDIRSILD